MSFLQIAVHDGSEIFKAGMTGQGATQLTANLKGEPY
jgi:Flp pilus assembly CpaF family ATPase